MANQLHRLIIVRRVFPAFLLGFTFFFSQLLFSQELTTSPIENINGEEIVDKRTRRSKTFKTSDNQFKLITSPTSIHYKVGDEWKPIDLNVKESRSSGFKFENTQNSYQTFFPSNPVQSFIHTQFQFGVLDEKVTQLYYTDSEGNKLSNVELSSNMTATHSGNSVRYKNVSPYADLQYTLNADSRKFDYILKDRSFIHGIPSQAAALVLEEQIILPKGWRVNRTQEGIELIDMQNHVAVLIQEPMMHESLELGKSYEIESDFLKPGSLSYNLDGNILTVNSHFSTDWITSNKRDFPIHLDPILTFDPQAVNFWTGYQTNLTAKTNGFLRVANVNSHGWAKFDIEELPPSPLIVEANYYGYHYVTTGSPDKITDMMGMGNVDPVTASGADISGQILSNNATNYNDNYTYGGNVYQWRKGEINEDGRTEIASHADRDWTAVGFKYSSGSTTFMYHYGWNGNAGQIVYLEVDYVLSDIEMVDVRPVTNFSSMCRLSSYDIRLTLRNNGPGVSMAVDILIEMDGMDPILLEDFDVSGLDVGQTRNYVISSEQLIPNIVGTGIELSADILTPDLDEDNNKVVRLWDVLSTPFGAEILPDSDFPGFPRDGNRFNQDYITYNKTYTYNISSPASYNNNSYGTDWIAEFTPRINGSQMPASLYTYTPPQGGQDARVSFELNEDHLNAEIRLDFVVTDISGNGCDSTTSRYAIVMPTPKPDFDGEFVCEVDELQFVNRSTIASGVITTFWDFGDGSDPSTLYEPSKMFDSVGTYQVKLITTSNIGFVDSITKTVVVAPSPTADFEFVNRCGSEPVQFTNFSDISVGTLNYFWNFGNGASATDRNPEVVYDEPGQYNVTLEVESDLGCRNQASKISFSYPSPNVDFDVDEVVCAGSHIQFENNTTIAFSDWGNEWNFESGKRTFATHPEYRYTEPGIYTVSLKVTTQYGCSETVEKDIEVIPGPVIDLQHTDACIGNDVVFNSNITAPSGMFVEFLWIVDGQVSGSPSPAFTFNEPGHKNLELTVSFDNGCENSIHYEFNTGYKPSAHFEMPEVICSGDELLIANKTVIDFATPNYLWDMGDGATYTSFAPRHVYSNSEPETYVVTLIASSFDGACPDTVVQVVNSGVTPVCDFEIEEDYLPGHRAFNFVPQNQVGNVSYRWLFGDGFSSDEANPLYQYQRDGEFNVRLLITSEEGCFCESVQMHSFANLSVNDQINQNDFKIYPNPSQGIFKLDNPMLHTIQTVHVYNAMGESVWSQDINQDLGGLTLDLSHVAAGIYHVEVITPNARFANRLIVVK